MNQLRIYLLGRLHIECAGTKIAPPPSARAQRLLCFLLLHPNKPHGREFLSEVVSAESPPEQARKGLRQALWQVRSLLDQADPCIAQRMLAADPGWVQIKTSDGVWIDVHEFERTYADFAGHPAQRLGPDDQQRLRRALALYQGDLLESCYEDWCVFERERVQNMHIALLDRMVTHCHLAEEFDSAIDYATEILRYDHANERAHQRLISAHLALGDRTMAMRQFEMCAAALKREFGIEPSQDTRRLLESKPEPAPRSPPPAGSADSAGMPPDSFAYLRTLQLSLVDLQHQLDQSLKALMDALDDAAH